MTDHHDPCSPCYYLKNSFTEYPLFQCTHTHRIEQLLQEFDAGSALLVPVARTVISGPRGSMKGCVFECVRSLMCLCVWTWKALRSFTQQKTAQSLQVALWKIVSSRGTSPDSMCADADLCQWASNHLRSLISPIATLLTLYGSSLC